MSSSEVYREHGIMFTYPSGWSLEESVSDGDDLTISLTDGIAFWTLTLMWERPPIERVLSEAKTAFDEEYDELDALPVQEKISLRDSSGYDISFVCLELINHVYLRCFRTGRFTAFIMYQMTDHEQKYYEPLFKEITESIDADQDGDVFIG
ncbi:hypothetical protein [Thalassoglobus polymorphus]|uniref:DUF3805 domain-containing protein n=1 Tax=Thalassoglobus polymorphus TaxID=2527994 RepID=A0A517QMD7_9PLAN|nr:hypothetical protein [Thalassoglobus polymorphus]QDT32804.1 hypothetical protein Mal48_20510 [Thalassoglobus polymorphus]